MNVLITGGAGFIGSHLADACIAEGDCVVALDDLSTGRIDNIAHLITHPRFTFVNGSIADAVLVGRLMDRCDAVYHLAAVVGMRLVVSDPLATFRANVFGTEVVLEAAAGRNRRTLFASTSELYGLNERKPTPEDEVCVLGSSKKNRWSYAYSKAAGEVLAMAYHYERELPVTVVRLFNTVGARQTGRYGMVVPTFVRQALAGEPLTVHGDGSQTRCFGDVHEIVRALTALMRNAAASGEIFNVGAVHEISILDLARRVLALTRSTAEIAFVPFSEAYEPGFEEILRRVPDISKLRALTGFNPQTPLDTILRNVIAEQQQQVAV